MPLWAGNTPALWMPFNPDTKTHTVTHVKDVNEVVIVSGVSLCGICEWC